MSRKKNFGLLTDDDYSVGKQLPFKCKILVWFWMCLPLKFLLLQKSTTHTNMCRSRKSPYVWPFSQSSQKTERERAVATGLLARSSWKLDISEAHVFLRMHKDDVQNALMKNALDVSCSSTLAYFFSTINFQVKVSKKLILLLWFLGSLFDNTTSELLTTQCRKFSPIEFSWTFNNWTFDNWTLDNWTSG